MGCAMDSHTTENTRGSRFGYHWFIERGEAGPVFGIKWVPSTGVKNTTLNCLSRPALLVTFLLLSEWASM